MKQEQLKIQIECDEQAASELRNALKEESEDQMRFVERRNIGGDAGIWIAIITLVTQTIPHVLKFLESKRGLDRVKRIKIGDLEIENPSPEDVERIKNEFFSSKQE